MPLFGRLAVPSFDLCWLNMIDSDPMILIPGGGGSTKSGVANSIQIARINNKNFEMLPSLETDIDGKSHLCSGIGTGIIKDKSIVCTCTDQECFLYTAILEEDGLSLELVCTFKADFGSSESSLNCVCLLPIGVIITGGDDAVCRVWIPRVSKTGQWTVAMVAELKGHSGPIMAINYHPIDRLVCTASKDGTVKIWSLSSFSCVGTAAASVVVDLMGADNATARSNVNSSSATPSLECRGCSFSEDGEYLYTIQCARRGATTLVKWELVPYLDDDGSELSSQANSAETKVTKKGSKSQPPAVVDRFLIDCFPVNYVQGCKVPSTRLKSSDSGEYLAVGGSDGSVTVFRTENNKLERISTEVCHDLPVTGLSFAPQGSAYALVGAPELVVSCSADNKVAAIKLGGPSFLFVTSMVMLSLAFLISLVALTVLIFFEEYSLQIITAVLNYGREMHFEL